VVHDAAGSTTRGELITLTPESLTLRVDASPRGRERRNHGRRRSVRAARRREGRPRLARSSGGTGLLIVGEAHQFLDEVDDVANNYAVWAGLRVVFR
jgi:hypothetical protein